MSNELANNLFRIACIVYIFYHNVPIAVKNGLSYHIYSQFFRKKFLLSDQKSLP